MLTTFSSMFIRLYLPPLVYMAAIFAFSASTTISPPFIDKPSVDKIYHVIEYLILGYLVLRVLEQGWRMHGAKLVALAFIIGAIYGLSDEIHQLHVPGRYFSLWDLAADSAGSALGIWIYLKVRL